MTGNNDSNDTGIWVDDYVTSAGVQVAGHWRRRRQLAGHLLEEHSAAGGSGNTNSAAARPTFTAAPPAAAGPVAAGTSDRLQAAERRYQAALVAVGIHSLQRGRRNPEAAEEARNERAAAKAELVQLRQEHPAPGRSEVPAGAEPSDGPPSSSQTIPSRDRCPDCGQYRADGHTCPIPAGLPAGDYAGLKDAGRVKAMVADLESSVKAIVESGQLGRWLTAMASNGLGRWSANNRLLAALQMMHRGESLEGLHMMGFRQWEKFNRKVSKGARAVWILAPMTRKFIEVDADGKENEKTGVFGFKGVPVFNISDTHGDPLPEPPVSTVAGEATPGTLEGLRDRVGAAGYTYEETEIPGCQPEKGLGTLGYTQPATKRIVVDSRLSSAQKAFTIAHELGHVHCGHVDGDLSEYRQHRGRMETEAEMTAYLVTRSRGMSRTQADAFSPGYIASWSKGDAAVMHSALEKATNAYNTILAGPWPGSR